MDSYKLIGYYKYIFTFKNSQNKLVCIGGDAGDIYRMNIDPNKEYTLEDLKAFGDIF
jgi:hypothetical protein